MLRHRFLAVSSLEPSRTQRFCRARVRWKRDARWASVRMSGKRGDFCEHRSSRIIQVCASFGSFERNSARLIIRLKQRSLARHHDGSPKGTLSSPRDVTCPLVGSHRRASIRAAAAAYLAKRNECRDFTTRGALTLSSELTLVFKVGTCLAETCFLSHGSGTPGPSRSSFILRNRIGLPERRNGVKFTIHEG